MPIGPSTPPHVRAEAVGVLCSQDPPPPTSGQRLWGALFSGPPPHPTSRQVKWGALLSGRPHPKSGQGSGGLCSQDAPHPKSGQVKWGALLSGPPPVRAGKWGTVLSGRPPTPRQGREVGSQGSLRRAVTPRCLHTICHQMALFYKWSSACGHQGILLR